MLPVETKYTMPVEVSSLQSTERMDGYQRQMCLLPSDLNKNSSLKQYYVGNRNYQMPSRLINGYVSPLQSEWNRNNKMIPYGYYFQYDQYENRNTGNFCRASSYPIPFKPPYTPLESNVNGIPLTLMTRKIPMSEFNSSLNKRVRLTYSTEETEPGNHVQSWSNTKQDHMMMPSLPYSTSSWSTKPTSDILPPLKKRPKYRKRIQQLPLEQPLAYYPNISTEPIFPNCCPSLPLPQMTNTLPRPSVCTCQIDLIKTSAPSNSYSTMIQQYPLTKSTTDTVEAYQTSDQCLSNQRCSYVNNQINYYSTNNLSYNMPYFATTPHESYYMCPFNTMPTDLPAITYPSPPLSESSTTDSPPSLTNNMKKINKKQDILQKPKVAKELSVKVQKHEKKTVSICSKTKTSIVKKRSEKESKIEDNRRKTLLKRMKRQQKLAISKFMVYKRKQQQSSKKNQVAQVNIEKDIAKTVNDNLSKPTDMDKKLPTLIASGLKITFNSAQKIESISLSYHQRQKPEMNTKNSLITPHVTDNRLNLLIEAVNFIEMFKDNEKITGQSIE